jgi:hypothetical protein
MTLLFANFEQGGMFNVGGQFEDCYFQMLNILCTTVAPPCTFSQEKQKCSPPKGRHCDDNCGDFSRCLVINGGIDLYTSSKSADVERAKNDME